MQKKEWVVQFQGIEGCFSEAWSVHPGTRRRLTPLPQHMRCMLSSACWYPSSPLVGGGWCMWAWVEASQPTQAAHPCCHELTEFTTTHLHFNCDDCGRKGFPRNTVLHGCRACNYDLCLECWHQKKKDIFQPHVCSQHDTWCILRVRPPPATGSNWGVEPEWS